MGLFEKFEENKDNVPRLPLSIKDLVDADFIIEEIRYVENVDTHFGVKDAYVMDIIYDDIAYTVWSSHKAIANKFNYLLTEKIDYRNKHFTIRKKQSCSGNMYYDITDI